MERRRVKGRQQFFTGYIEGYFGRVLNWQQRYGIIDTLAGLEMNTYLYAPKEDPYHRIKWRESFPPQWRRNLKELAEYGTSKGVTVIPAIAPGLSFHYAEKSDVQLLSAKFEQLFELGMKKVALLMDDIPLVLPRECEGRFQSLGEAHGKLLQTLLAAIKAIYSDAELFFCPSVYSDQFVEGCAVDSSYIKDLKAAMPEEITLFWTGDRIISQTIDEKSCGDICNLFGNKVIFWDNLYANDYAPNRLFVGGFEGRDHSFVHSTAGIMINPTGLYETDKFLLHHLAGFLAGEKEPDSCWQKTAELFEIPEKYREIKDFFWLPYSTVDESRFTKESINRLGNLYDELIVPWVHPLKLEWYPWLMGLYLDFEIIRSDKRNNPQWLQQRYSPVVAHMIKSRNPSLI